ncbi:MAG: alpha/beta hydrolase [Sphingomonadales bacterium]|nr:MAG: alpha/beta hydrolase [Sphingomonadales bacterium]
MTRHLVDPELLGFLEQMPTFNLDHQIMLGARDYMAGMAEPRDAYARADVAIQDIEIPGPKGAPAVRVTVYTPTPATKPMPAYIHLHGGAYLMGNPAFAGRENTNLAADLGCLIVSVDYRCAPEDPAPAAIEDSYAALAWVHDNAAKLGVDTGRVAIGGDSAGGGLAASLALLARDRGQYPVCFQLLVYPMLDDRTAVSKAVNPNVGEFVWNNASNLFAWGAYLGQPAGSDGVSPYYAAARATDLSGLPPAYIGVGSLDLFMQEDIAYAERLLAAGVPTELHIFPGCFHSFDQDQSAAIGRRGRDEFHAALARGFKR